MRLLLCLALFAIGTVGCDLVTDPEGPSPEDFEYDTASTNVQESSAITQDVSTTTDARLRQRHERFAD